MEVLLLEDLAPDARQWLAARHGVDYRPELLQDLSLLRRQLYKTEALVAPPGLMVNTALLDFAPRLMALGRLHDSSENIDYEACQRRQVRVIQVPEAMVRARAEFALLKLLELLRLPAQTPGQRLPGREINDRIVALLGMTPTAQALATMLLPLGVRVIGYDPAVHHSAELWERLGVQPAGLQEMLELADAVSVQMHYAQRYQGFLNERVLAACKPGQLWVCIARPQLFDLNGLANVLRNGRMGRCVLDADSAELLGAGSPLLGQPQLQITPRLAALTQEAHLRASWFLVDRIHETLCGDGPHSVPGVLAAMAPRLTPPLART